MLTHILGGIGIFLLGMTLMTDGLKAFAGRTLRSVLSRWVRGNASGLLWGLLVTALVQSSTATTVTVIGFVGSGLMTFTQAVGVIFGANLGTTTTGWLVALLGLKYSIAAMAYPMIAVGAAMKLLGRERLAALGLALAGFSLIFVGIDHLQAGMQTLAADFKFEAYAPASLGGRLALILIGAGMTIVMQSSSAAMATVLAALHAGAVDFEHAAALVIGQNIGTTATAPLASIGGSVAARRTALAHVVFNLLTAVVAFFLFPVFTGFSWSFAGRFENAPSTLALAAFHSCFNLLGVTLFFPVIRQYSDCIARVLPERRPSLAAPLDSALLSMPHSALDAARRVLMNVTASIADGLQILLQSPERRPQVVAMLDEADAALDETRAYLARVLPPPGDREVLSLRLGALHALDHLIRMSEDCRDVSALEALGANEEIRGYVGSLRTTLSLFGMAMKNNDPSAAMKSTEDMSLDLASARRRQRAQILEATAAGQISPSEGIALVESMRWIDRLAYHAWRALFHLQTPQIPSQPRQTEIPSDSEPPPSTAS